MPSSADVLESYVAGKPFGDGDQRFASRPLIHDGFHTENKASPHLPKPSVHPSVGESLYVSVELLALAPMPTHARDVPITRSP
jgi:hypothetical protein